MASTSADAHALATADRYFSFTLATQPALVTKSLRLQELSAFKSTSCCGCCSAFTTQAGVSARTPGEADYHCSHRAADRPPYRGLYRSWYLHCRNSRSNFKPGSSHGIGVNGRRFLNELEPLLAPATIKCPPNDARVGLLGVADDADFVNLCLSNRYQRDQTSRLEVCYRNRHRAADRPHIAGFTAAGIRIVKLPLPILSQVPRMHRREW